jgi:hypothetical protein
MQQPVPIEKAAADCQKGSLDLQKRLEMSAALGFGASDDDVLYGSCMSATSPQSCDNIPGARGGAGNASDCFYLKDFMATAWATIKQNDPSACMKFMHASYTKDEIVSAEKFFAMCGMLAPALRSGQVDNFGAQAVAKGFIAKSELASFINRNIDLRGQPELCDSGPNAKTSPRERAFCRARAALLGALRSGKPEACAASPLCNALTSHKAQACAPYLAAANKSFCGKVADMKTAREAALKKEAAELVLRRHIEAEKARRAEELQKKKAPKPQFHHGQKMQTIPPDVKQRMDEIEKQSKAAQ